MAKYLVVSIRDTGEGRVPLRLEEVSKTKYSLDGVRMQIELGRKHPIEYLPFGRERERAPYHAVRCPAKYNDFWEFAKTVSPVKQWRSKRSYVGLNSLDGEEEGILWVTGIFSTIKEAKAHSPELLAHADHMGIKVELFFEKPAAPCEDLWDLEQ